MRVTTSSSSVIFGAVGSLFCVSVTPQSLWCLAQALVLLVAIRYYANSWSHFKVACIWALPITVPLFLLHGLLNQGYGELFRVGWLPFPIRGEGIRFAGLLSSKILAISVAATTFSLKPREMLFCAAIRKKMLPETILVLLFQAIAFHDYLSERGKSIRMAQRTRGIPDGPGILNRVKSLIACVIPLVVITLSESDVRAQALVSRGCGVVPFQFHLPEEKGSSIEMLPVVILMALFSAMAWVC